MTLAFIVWVVMTVLPNMVTVCGFILAVWGFLAVLCLLVGPALSECFDTGFEEIWKKLPIKSLLLLPLFILIVVPDKHTSYAILAAYGVETIATNDKVQELGGKSLEVLEKAMEEYLKEGEEVLKESLPKKESSDNVSKHST